jgi:hypothetical protein
MTKLSRLAISSRVVSIADLRSLARRRLPRAVFDYLDGGAEGEVTLRENCRVFEDVTGHQFDQTAWSCLAYIFHKLSGSQFRGRNVKYRRTAMCCNKHSLRT